MRFSSFPFLLLLLLLLLLFGGVVPFGALHRGDLHGIRSQALGYREAVRGAGEDECLAVPTKPSSLPGRLAPPGAEGPRAELSSHFDPRFLVFRLLEGSGSDPFLPRAWGSGVRAKRPPVGRLTPSL